MEDDTWTIQEHKREKLTKKDYSQSTDEDGNEGLQQLETKQCRAAMRNHVTRLHKPGIPWAVLRHCKTFVEARAKRALGNCKLIRRQ